jgi:selenocysteine lyase/cysteine desulfurase
MLAATGRKFLRAPRGTGFLYVRRSWIDRLEPAFLDLHGATWTSPDTYEIRADARRFESWEQGFAGVVGLGAAAAYAVGWGLDAIGERLAGLSSGLRERLAEVPGVQLRDLGRRPSALVTFTKDGVDSEAIRLALQAQGINVSVSPPSSTLLDTNARSLPPMVRASVHYFNTDDELDRTTAAVAAL